LRELLQSKIHKATITEANLSYVGSVTIDPLLLDKVDLWAGQKVLIVSNTSGARLETYVIRGNNPGSGEICINGAAAHLVKKGEEVIIISFALSTKPIDPKCILVDGNNQFIKFL
jgi:aspartate 1-decarboxylase